MGKASLQSHLSVPYSLRINANKKVVVWLSAICNCLEVILGQKTKGEEMNKIRVKVEHISDTELLAVVVDGEYLSRTETLQYIGINEPDEYDIEVTPVRRQGHPILREDGVLICWRCWKCNNPPLPNEMRLACSSCAALFADPIPAAEVRERAGLEVEG